MDPRRSNPVANTVDLSTVNSLVLSAVNTPYNRTITADILARCLANCELHEWAPHIANLFSDVSPDLVILFAKLHGVDAARLAQTYLMTQRVTGEPNPELETALASLAPAT